MTDTRLLEAAERQGRTAGDGFRVTGTPSRNPYKAPDLAAAWRRGYFAAAKPRSTSRGR